MKNKLNLNLNITYTVHDKKAHGINLKELEGLTFDLLIVPDAGTNDIEQCKILKEINNELDIIILDHHNIEQQNPYALVVNCKDGNYENETLAGVGVVYKFFKEYDLASDNNFSEVDLDLVACGNIADMMDMRNLETRYLTLKGLENINNEFLKEIIEKNEYSIGEKLSISKVGWYISPLINAVTRVGTLEERIDVFKALVGEKEEREYQPRRKKKTDPKPEPIKESLQKYMARECANIKGRQDRIAKKGMEELSEIIENNGYDKEKIIVVEATDVLEKDFTGLIANKLASKYRKPIIILKSRNEEEFGGSGRNYSLSPIPNLNEFLQALNVFEEVAGHDNSFGFCIKKNKIDELREKIREALKDVVMEDTYIVDYEIPVGRLKDKHVLQVGEWEDLWGNSLQEPLFAITDIHTTTDNIKLLGEKKNIISFEVRGLKFIKKFANEDIYNTMILKTTKGLTKRKTNKIKMNVIAKFKLNKWNDNTYPQIEIVDFDVCEDIKSRF